MIETNVAIYQHKVEAILKTIFQNKLTFEFNRRQTKQGKFLLYKIHHHTIVFTLEELNRKKTQFIYRVPYPFTVDVQDNGGIVKFNYTMSALFGQGSPLICSASEYAQAHKPSRYYNNSLTIKVT